MRGYWRLIKVMAIATAYTAYAGLLIRFRPEAERPALRAHHQQVGSRMLCRAARMRVSVQGQPPEGRPMLYVCNHRSGLDPILLGSQMPVAFAGKAELRTWPVFGWICRTHGMLFVDRDRRTSTATFVKQVQEKLKAGVSVLVFPEGTTGWGDIVQPFKTGSFEAVAGREDGAVLPLFLDVASVEEVPVEPERGRRVFSHNNEGFIDHCLRLFSLKSADLQVYIGEPMPAQGRNRKELARLTHQAVTTLGGLALPEPETAEGPG